MEEPHFEYVSRWRRVLISLVDAALAFPLQYVAQQVTFARHTVLAQLALDAMFLTVSVALTVSLGATPGKLLLGARVVDRAGRLLTVRAAILRHALYIAIAAVSLLQLRNVLAALANSTGVPTPADIGQAFIDHGGYLHVQGVLSALSLIDVAVILFNHKRRALHDFLAGSYVITRRSYLAIRGLGPEVVAPEPPRRASLPVRILAVALMFASAISLLFGGLFHFLPMLLMREFRAEGLAGDAGLTVLMLGTGLLETFVTLVAAVALLRDRGWGRAWIVCASLANFIPPILFVLRTGDASPFWPLTGEDLSDPFAAARLISGSGTLVLSGIALVLLLVFDRPRRVRRRAWVLSATAVLLLVGTGWFLSPVGRRDLEHTRIAATPVEAGSGTAVVTLLYDGKPVAEPDGVLAYVTLQDMRTKQQSRVTVPLANGSVTLPNLGTGVYAVGVVLDANQRNGLTSRNRPMAGDYEGFEGRISLLRNEEVAAGEVKMIRMLRLLRPDDTETGLARQDCARVASPAEFEWEPVPRAVGYRCFVSRRWKEGESWRSEYAESSYGPSTTCRMTLPRNTGESLYEIKIEADGETGVITRFEDPRRGWASEYCFVVE